VAGEPGLASAPTGPIVPFVPSSCSALECRRHRCGEEEFHGFTDAVSSSWQPEGRWPMKDRMDEPGFPVKTAPSRRRRMAARSMLPPVSRVSYANPRASARSSRQVTVSRLLFSGRARPLRFAFVGAGCGLLQLLLLVALKLAGLPGVPANVGAYLLSAQVNFVLSNRFIWHDRWVSGPVGQDLARRWLRFHASILGTFLLSQAVFILGRFVLADVVASALGIAVSGVGNFLIQDLVTFRRLSTNDVRSKHWAKAARASVPRRSARG